MRKRLERTRQLEYPFIYTSFYLLLSLSLSLPPFFSLSILSSLSLSATTLRAWYTVSFFCFNLTPGHLAYVLGGQIITSRDSHCTRPSGQVNLWPARSPGFVQRDLVKTSIIHIALSKSLHPLNPHCKKDLVPNPAWWKAQINIYPSLSLLVSFNLLFQFLCLSLPPLSLPLSLSLFPLSVSL